MVLDCVFCGEEGEQGKRSFFVFLKSPEQKTAWIKNMNIQNFVPSKYMRLCSDHFEEKCFQTGGNNVKLNPGSQPTIFRTYKSACAACKVQKNEADKQRSFHKFPLKNKGLLNEWLRAMRIESFTPTRKSILCSDHFEKSCFVRCGNIRLKNEAVPTIFSSLNLQGRKRKHSPDLTASEVTSAKKSANFIWNEGDQSISPPICTTPTTETPNIENLENECPQDMNRTPFTRGPNFWFSKRPDIRRD